MCGIAGLFARDANATLDGARVVAMCVAQAHRGPDGAGLWTAPGVALGHRRLAIIDLTGGAQPMGQPESPLTITFNGEIYNYREVRADLIARGHTFATDSDTEVLLAGWREWGDALLPRLVGMFAFAIHDARDRSLTLVRDRLGVKPLHYAALPDGTLAFASELKGLLALPDLARRPDVTAIDDFLAWGYVPDHGALVAGVSKLPAGSILRVAHGAPPPSPIRWWDISFADRDDRDERTLAEELRTLLAEAVRARMIADVPLGAFLSGGVDSSTVVALMAGASDRPVDTCTIGFDVAALDETGYARQVAARFHTAHRERIVDPADFALVDRIAADFDEPFADASALPTYRVCALARERVTVALSGDGADEAFGGYRRHLFQAGEARARALLPAPLRACAGVAGRAWPRMDWAPRPLRLGATLTNLGLDADEAYARSVGIIPPEQRARLYTPELTQALGGWRAEDRMIAVMRGAPARTALDRAQYADLTFWLPGDILTKTDRMSMAVSLEVREPLLDHRLVAFAARLPDRMRVRRGTGKWLLKRAMADTLPPDILYRPKMGFVTPIAAWLRGPLADEALAIARGGALGRSGWFDGAALARIADDHVAGRADHGRLLWQLLMLDRALSRLFAL